MSGVAIRVEGLSKQYRLGGAQQRYKTLRDSITNSALRPFRRWRNKDHQDPVDSSLFWALKDVSFEIKAGEVVGVIGRNGAGKSTLLKVLSRITEPTAGYAEIHGRVGSLLEVGTGFHPELSGRENIYLNGAILGMRRTEVERKFDEIVSFAEVEQFVDTPVKFYSTGMYLRLAFAVAASLDPNILLVDEVLAVGDRKFQDKCLGRMQDIGTSGRTVVLVSHNMAAIGSLATRVVVLDQGAIRFAGSTAEGLQMYGDISSRESSEDSYSGISLLTPSTMSVGGSSALRFDFRAKIPSPAALLDAVFILTNSEGQRLVVDKSSFSLTDMAIQNGTTHSIEIVISMPALWLASGMYNVQLRLYPVGVGMKKSIFSPTYPLTIGQEGTGYATKGLLTPEVSWEVQ